MQKNNLYIFSCDIFSSNRFIRLFYYRKNMISPKNKVGLVSPRNTTSRCPPIAFRTILKCRNNSIQASPDNGQSLQKSMSASRISSLNKSMSDFHLLPCRQKQESKYLLQEQVLKQGEISSQMEIKGKQLAQTTPSRQIAKSKIVDTTSRFEQINQTTKKHPSFLEQLEKRIQNLLKEKLEKFKTHKQGVGLSNWQYLKKDTLQSELSQLVTEFKICKDTDQGIPEIASRVQLIQKMIASQAIQSQLIKSRYFGFKNQRSNIASYHSKKLLNTSSLINESQHLQVQTQSSNQMFASIGSFSTTNKESYSKPSKESYINTRYKHPAYSPNRQVLPRSSYSTQFLKYGVMPTFDCKYKGSQCLPTKASLAVKASAYQLEFKERYNISKPVNFRQLDCYRDKFKNPNISFMNNCKKEMIDASKNLKKAAKANIQPKPAGCKLSKLLSQTSLNDFYKSQQRRNYQGHSGTQSQQLDWVRGIQKNQHLNQLKVGLRESYLRG